MNINVPEGNLCSLVVSNGDGTRLNNSSELSESISQIFVEYLGEAYDFSAEREKEEGPLKKIISDDLYNIISPDSKRPIYRVFSDPETIKIVRMGIDNHGNEEFINGLSDEKVFRGFKNYLEGTTTFLNLNRLSPFYALSKKVNNHFNGNGSSHDNGGVPRHEDVRGADYREPANR